MARILAVGIATLDIINSVDGYPAEDAEVRAVSQRICRGGNATNTLVVLSQLGHACSWAGVTVDEPDARHILADLAQYRIDASNAVTLPEGKVPTSYIAQDIHSGSRTIIHYRDLPEFSLADFETINLDGYHWLHFEGRNVDDCRQMMQLARQRQPQLPLSLEIEKERPGIDDLIELAEVVLFSKALAQGRGFEDGQQFLTAMQPHNPNATFYCGWGSEGAYALFQGQHYFSPAQPPATVVDTLAAGDTFNAAVIDGHLRGLDCPATLTAACQLAGRKCGVPGLDIQNLINTDTQT